MSQSTIATTGVRGGRFVAVVCEQCGSSRQVPYEMRNRRFCAKPATCCYDYLKRPKLPLTDEQRQANEMVRRQRSADARRGAKRTPEQRARISEGTKQAWVDGRITSPDYDVAWTPEKRAAQASRTVQMYRDGRLDLTGHYKGKHTLFQSATRSVPMRSQSEALFAHMLDGLGVQWEYEPQRFDLGWATYTPDFRLTDFDHWVEVKGWWTESSRRKFDEFAPSHSASSVMAKPLLKGVVLTLAQIMEGVE